MLADEHPAHAGFPGLATGPRPFVGREAERAELRAGARRLAAGTGSVFLVAGEPGIGKTRLADEVAASAAREGARVHWGRCWEGAGVPPYWPWAQVVRSVLGGPPAAATTDLATLVPGAVEAPNATGVIDDRDRFELFDATVTFLAKATVEEPRVIVLDDLHASDLPSLLLLRFLARSVADLPIMVIGTYRPAAARRAGMADELAEVARSGSTLHLEGLGAEAVASYLDATTPEAAGDTVAGVHELTRGNPLFLDQVSRLLASGHVLAPVASSGMPASLPTVPTGVLDAVSARLDPLGAESIATLWAAAVLGRRADVGVLARILDEPAATVREQLEPAVELDVIRPVAGVPDEVSFVHPLVWEVLYGSLGRTERRRLHRGAAEAIAALVDSEDRDAETAHHLLAAGPDLAGAAMDAYRRAGDRSLAALAYEDAVLHYEHGLQAAGTSDADDGNRCDLLIGLGRARWSAMDRQAAHEAFDLAGELAGAIGDADRLAAAALGGGYEFAMTGDGPGPRLECCEEALELLDGDDGELRARLLVQRTAELLRTGDAARCQEAAADAVSMARRVANPDILGHALVAEQDAELGPASLAARLASTAEIGRLARESGNRRLAVHGHFLRIGNLLEQGDTGALDAEVRTQARVIETLGERGLQRFALWARAMRATLDGHFADAERLADAAFEAALEAEDPDAFLVHAGQIGVLRWAQDRIMEMEPLYRDLARDDPDQPLWPVLTTWIGSIDGRRDEAQGGLDRLGVHRFADVPPGQLWLLTMAVLADTAATLGDRVRGASVFDALDPYADRVVTIGQGTACWTPVARPLGRLAAVLGRPGDAVAHLETSIAIASRMGARPWIVESQLDLAEVLVAHAGDGTRSRELVDQAAVGARRLAMPALVARSEALATTLGIEAPAGEAPVKLAPTVTRAKAPPTVAAPLRVVQRTAVNVLGAFAVHPDGRPEPARWSSRKARHLLKVLVARRGKPLPREVAMDLLWPDQDPRALGNRLSVALSTVRRTLDPDRRHPPDHLVEASHGAVRLRVDRLAVDLERFLDDAAYGLSLRREGRRSEAAGLLRSALAAYRGPAFVEDVYEEWAIPVRDEARAALLAVARAQAVDAVADGDIDLARVHYLHLLEEDPYDEDAHLALVAALAGVGAHGDARRGYERYTARMDELGVDSSPFPAAG